MPIIETTRTTSDCHQYLVSNLQMPISSARKTEVRAGAMLDSHPYFKGRSQWIRVRCSNGYLYLEGTLPSYYLKQLAQEALRDLAGIEQVVNQIVVASPVGDVGCCDQAVVIAKLHSSTLTSNPKPR